MTRSTYLCAPRETSLNHGNTKFNSRCQGSRTEKFSAQKQYVTAPHRAYPMTAHPAHQVRRKANNSQAGQANRKNHSQVIAGIRIASLHMRGSTLSVNGSGGCMGWKRKTETEIAAKSRSHANLESGRLVAATKPKARMYKGGNNQLQISSLPMIPQLQCCR